MIEKTEANLGREAVPKNNRQISRVTLVLVVISAIAFFSSFVQGVLNEPVGSHGYVLLAEAFLHGRLDIQQDTSDIAVYEGRHYLPFPPFPAVLLVPSVALFGGAGVKVGLVALCLTCVNVIIFWRILGKLGGDLDSRIWLALALFLGTGYWIVVACANVWSFAHVVAVTFVLLALYEALGAGRGIVAGLLLGCAVLSRQMTVYLSLFILAALWVNDNRVGTRSRVQSVLGFGLVLCAFVLAYLGYNWARFDNPFQTGYSLICHEGPLRARFERYGLFHLAYLPFNFTYMFLQGPHFEFGEGLIPWGMDLYGTSLLFASPFVLFAFAAKWNRFLLYAAWAAIGLALSHMLLYYNNGWVQVNNQRFALDFLPLLMLLVALSVGHVHRRWMRISIAYAVLLNCVALFILPVVRPWVISLIKRLLV